MSEIIMIVGCVVRLLGKESCIRFPGRAFYKVLGFFRFFGKILSNSMTTGNNTRVFLKKKLKILNYSNN